MNSGLRVSSTHHQSAHALIDLLAEPALAFIRNQEGIVGLGEALRLRASGPQRIAELASQWNQLLAVSTVDDQVQMPGSGLTAFGSIAFGDFSSIESVLVVPQVLIGVRDGRGWITIIDGLDEPINRSPVRENQSVQLKDSDTEVAEYLAAVSKAITEIEVGKLEKVVLARQISSQVGLDFDLRSALSRLAESYPACWTYAVDGTFGASPELLVRVSHGQVATRVLAGTMARGENEQNDLDIAMNLKHSHKNLSEHRLALDSVTRALKPLTVGVEFDETPFAVKLPNLWHLASDVHAVLATGVTGLDLVAALHPTAAVAGTPRSEALELIGELESFDRGRYAGPVGWISSSGDCEWAIALRGGQLSNGILTAFAGCGIVAESDPQQELLETNLKLKPVRESLA